MPDDRPGAASPRSSHPVDMSNGGHDTTTKVTGRAATQGGCPFRGTRVGGALGSEPQLDHWWPKRLKVELLHQNPPSSDPLRGLDYRAAFEALDHEELKDDLRQLMHSSVDWWPSDYGHYGPQMIRMAWHAAGTYRIADGRGGASRALQRVAPLNSWWDNGNIDKSRRLLWPIKQKYGAGLSWGDLMILAGNIALEEMGFPTFGFSGGRIDFWESDRSTYWGPEGWQEGDAQPERQVSMAGRWRGGPKEETWDLENPVGATHQALIYVNPEGPGANGDPMDSAREIRESFARMAMNDEETVALIAGGHAFGKSHGKVEASKIGPPPDAAPLEAMGFGWHNPVGSGNAEHTSTNGIEGSWTPNPTRWDNDYLTNLFRYEWEQTRSPAGALQWRPTDPDAPTTPDAHVEGQRNELMMMTSDLALKVDPAYREVCERFLEDFDAFTDAFSRAWYKLTHRDLGPKSRYMGPDVPEVDLPWQDPLPALDHGVVGAAEIADLEERLLACGVSPRDLVAAAWASASTYRDSDRRGGANGGRVRLEPQRSWEENEPETLARTLDALEAIKRDFDGSREDDVRISMADLIVLGGCVAVKRAAQEAGADVDVPFVPGRVDTSEEWTDGESFEWLRPVVDGFRNHRREGVEIGVPAEHLFLDKAELLDLSAPEWVALTGGLRVLGIGHGGTEDGCLTDRPGVLTNDFFTTLTSMEFRCEPVDDSKERFRITRRDTGEVAHHGTRCDLVFGSNAELRSIAEVYAAADGQERLVRDFVAAWHKVMMLDRFDVPEERRRAVNGD